MSAALVTIYATDWCPFCQGLIYDLDQAAIDYELIDVDADEQAAAWVESVNDGNRIVPTVRYSDDEVQTNPPAAQVIARVEQLQQGA